MAVTGVAGWANIRGLKVQLMFPEEIYSDTDTLVVMKVTNLKRHMPSFLLQVVACGRSADIDYLGASSTENESMVVRFPGRGMHPLDEALVFSPFPVNFFVRCNRLPIGQQCLVFPSPIHAPSAHTNEHGRRDREMWSLNKGMEGEMTRIRDYAGGDALKMIHWRLSAKHSLLKVKELGAAGGEPVIIDPRGLPGATLNARLSFATFLVNRLIRDNRPVGLRVNDRIIAPQVSRSHRLRLLTELALYDQN